MNYFVFIRILFFFVFILSLSAFCLDINYKRVSASNNKIHVFSNEEIIIAGENGKLIKTYDAGVHWHWIETNTRNSFISMYFNSNGKGVLNTNSEIFYSYDKGESWNKIIQFSDSSIFQSIIPKNRQDIIFSQGSNLLKTYINNKNIDTILKTNDIITHFFVIDSIIYLSTQKEFYKLVNEEVKIRTLVKGHYNSRINNFAVINNNILIGGADTNKNNYSNFLMKSSDGGKTFDSVKFKDIGYIHRIITADNNFVVMNSWGILFQYSQDFNFVKSYTIKPTQYLKFSKDLIILKDIFDYNNIIYFCGRDQSVGYLQNSKTKLLKYAPSQYPVPLYGVYLTNIKKYDNKLFALSSG